MQGNFWKKIKKPIFAMAPMSGVTDEAFRQMFLKYKKPGVFWTEFVSVDGLLSTRGKDYCLKVLEHSPRERPIVAQIFGANPTNFEKAAKIIAELGFDGIDINMGCPDRDIEKKGGGAALIKNPELAKEIIRATVRGAGKLPVSVKTRIGYSKNEISKWIPVLLKENISALTVHFRTRKQMYMPPAHWELAKEIVKLRDKYAPACAGRPKTLIIGNGDVKSLTEAKQLAKENGLDGIMAGRAVLGQPWFFAPRSLGEVGFGATLGVKKILKAIVEHAEIFSNLNRGERFDVMKKHFHAYAKNFTGAKELREKLMKTKNIADVIKAVDNWRF